jgi:hypothetical protein
MDMAADMDTEDMASDTVMDMVHTGVVSTTTAIETGQRHQRSMVRATKI